MREDFKPKDKISNSEELKILVLFEYTGNCKYVIYTQEFLNLVVSLNN